MKVLTKSNGHPISITNGKVLKAKEGPGNNPWREEILNNFHSPTKVIFHEYPSLPSYSLYNQKYLTEVEFVNNTTTFTDFETYSLGSSGANSGLTITLPNSTSSIADNAFYASSIKSITIPNNVTTLGRNAFYACTSLTSVVFEEGGSAATSLDSGLFRRCYALTTVTLNGKLRQIPSGCFEYCTSLQTITITFPELDYTAIGNYAFSECSSLAEVKILSKPAHTTSPMASNAFSNCANLTSLKVCWSEGEIPGAPWGATNATITYNYTE